MRNASSILELAKDVLSEKIPSNLDKTNLSNLQGLNLDPSSLSFVLKATYFYQKKNYQKSSIYYCKAIALQPNNAYLNFKYGMSFYKLKDWVEAHKYIKKALELDPTKQEWKVQFKTTEKLLQNESKLSQKELKIKLQKDTTNEKLIEKYASLLFENKNYWLSQFQFGKLLEINPYSEIALFKLGLVFEKLSDYDSALNCFNKVANLHTDSIIYKYHIGYCYERLGNYKKARIYYDIVEMFSPKGSEVSLFGVGALHARNHYWDCAIKSYEFFESKSQPPNEGLYYRMGITYEKLYKWDEAAIFFEKAIQFSPVVKASWCYKCGQSYEKSENFQNAVIYYREAVSRSNNYNDYWWFRLGCALENSEYYEEASKAFTESRRRKYLHAVSPKGVIKNKNQDYLSYYTEYYETLKVESNLVMLESFLASTVSGNPYAILIYMLEKNYNFKYIVVIKEGSVIPEVLKFNKNIIFINRGSDAYLRYLCSAKYLINNVSFPYYFIRKSDQVYLNTWHGTPMKTLGKDIKEPFQDHANVARNFLQATHIISQNRYTSNILLEQYDIKGLFSGKIAETGYPRVDLSLNLSNDKKYSIAKRIGVNLNKPIVLYAPTWRGTSETKKFDIAKLKKDLVYLNDKSYQVVFKGHHLVEKILSNLSISNVIIASNEVDTNELLGITDILISDYSSIVFDFLKLDRPIISYVYDFESYKKERGLYISKNDMLGDICEDIKKVKKSIIKYLPNLKSNLKNSDVIKFANFDDGHASKRVVDFMLNKDNSSVWNYEIKKQLVFFNGPFIPNGISRSFLNLMSSIDHDEFNVTVIINRADVEKHSQRLLEFSKLPDNISVISRVGSTPMTLEELSIRDSFEKNYNFYSDSYEDRLVKLYKRESRRLFGDASIETVINFEGYALFWVSLISQVNANKKVIFQHNDKYREWKTRFPYLEGVFRFYSYYDTIAAVSKGTMENNRENLALLFDLPADKFTYINNSINIEQILTGANKNIELENCFTQFDGVKFINMGRMSHEKDQNKLIQAFAIVKKKYSSVRLYILGDGDLRVDLERKIENLGLTEDVYLLGQKENPFAYLKHANVFVLSSNHEGQPMVLLEALTLGLPVIATDIVGNRSVLEDKYGKLVENSEKGLVEGMVSFVEEGSPLIKFDASEYQKEALNKFYSIIY